MLESISQLLILQHTDQRLGEVTQALEELPKEKLACERALRNADQKLSLAHHEEEEIEKEIKKRELEILTKQAQVARYRTQQMETRKNEEYAALDHQITAAQAAIAQLEERQLLLMEKKEFLQPALERAREIHQIEYKRVNTLLGTMEGRSKNLQARLEELQEERPRLTLAIEEDLLELYERLFKSKHGVALAAIEHGVCRGCHMQVTTQIILSAKAEKEIIFCPHCGRFLYTEED